MMGEDPETFTQQDIDVSIGKLPILTIFFISEYPLVSMNGYLVIPGAGHLLGVVQPWRENENLCS